MDLFRISRAATVGAEVPSISPVGMTQNTTTPRAAEPPNDQHVVVTESKRNERPQDAAVSSISARRGDRLVERPWDEQHWFAMTK